MSRVESPISGWPRTVPLDGQVGYRVRAKYLTPLRARLIDNFVCLSGVGCVIFVVWAYNSLPYFADWNVWALFASVFVPWFALLVTRFSWGRLLFGKVTIIEFTPELIRIKRLLRFRNYDRSLPHGFDCKIHDKAEWEQERELELKEQAAAEKKKKVPQPVKYFRRSFHVILRYVGQRVDVASVFGQKQAEGILARLQLLDQLMDAQRGESRAHGLADPNRQYGERPEAG